MDNAIEYETLFYYLWIRDPFSYKEGHHRGKQESKCWYVIVTIIGNPMSFSCDTMSSISYIMSDFHRQLFSKIQLLALTSNYIDHHSSLELLSVLKLLAWLGLFGRIFFWLPRLCSSCSTSIYKHKNKVQWMYLHWWA